MRRSGFELYCLSVSIGGRRNVLLAYGGKEGSGLKWVEVVVDMSGRTSGQK